MNVPAEMQVGGYSRHDSTVEFYTRIRAVLPADAVVLDVGAGRGAWLQDSVDARRRLRDLRDVARRVDGVDVDEVVRANRGLDHAYVIEDKVPWPLPSSTYDIAIADFVVEHLAQPSIVFQEAFRVLKEGGWFCARTTCRTGYVGLASRAIPLGFHRAVLRRAQPGREVQDVFPATYRCNTPRVLRQSLKDAGFTTVVVYGYAPEFAYGGKALPLARAVQAVDSIMPDSLTSTLLVFAKKAEAAG